MIRSTHAVRAAALAGAAALILAACSGGGEGSDDATEGGGGDTAAPLKVGTLLPQTGSLAQLGPPEIAGVDLAVEEINEAGGVLGSEVEAVHTDSSDAEHAEVATQSVQDLISQDVSVIIGAASSSVTRNVIDDITGSKIVQISPANTATDLSGANDFYFRTAPPDTVQGSALANLILGDGAVNPGILVFNDDYGTSLRNVVEKVVTDSGATLAYGSEGQEFDPNETNYASIVGNALAAQPDAIAIIAFTTQTPLIIAELAAQGYDMSKVYFVDGNLTQFGEEFQPGLLEGAQGTLPGAFPSDEFQERLLGINPDLSDFSYAAESYDATILAALAAVKGGATDGETIQANLPAVSGADGGEKCATYAECLELLDAGEDIDYEAQSGVGPFNEDNDPESAYIGVYTFGADNKYTFTKSEFGEVG
ncbi:ABC transporter substrate-binding protein [Cellulomonas fimi]|uniref:Extracellular ligand-binding receptor n=1 Tax=Cellulomonas fimi (strain ATCC 484 / DSM 20113 / JCM 1341 / CCUG 24087 / LMG 16345 / NBRC 15513 / NCIMB 8980 / NCTC 7547 / NRS-133) TaxID=590998 RepID=F4GYX0_CELFA|nr:ABC transporter substrate-binding protein [Cellulomonas fimi]AEE45960.1 Extracellular ligand-binding receptor [Cellulomonas fimi ATCC 484]NNH06546.1 amino acid ABC transporter substrate-binding protein [Cellulomonas fimi]VEH31122.1 Leucine-, isoleucine-, valine-, threonine-, and alanine-binding protein precursor [Cellulomonas fimi]